MARAVDDDPGAGRGGFLNGLPALGEQRVDGLAMLEGDVLQLSRLLAGSVARHQQQEGHRNAGLGGLTPEEPIHVHAGVAAAINATDLRGLRAPGRVAQDADVERSSRPANGPGSSSSSSSRSSTNVRSPAWSWVMVSPAARIASMFVGCGCASGAAGTTRPSAKTVTLALEVWLTPTTVGPTGRTPADYLPPDG